MTSRSSRIPASLSAQCEEGQTLSQVCRSNLEAIRVVLQHFVIFTDGLPIVLLHEGDFTEIELRIGGKLSAMGSISDSLWNSWLARS